MDSTKTTLCPPLCYENIAKGCPFDCGLCEAHRQITCTALLEVTGRCDLSCPFCFAASGTSPKTDPTLDAIQFQFDRVKAAAPSCNIQLSGGEPTVRNDLPRIIEMGIRSGFAFIQLNTNGLRLAREEGYARSLRDAGLSSVFLQFDGISDDVYLRLRGRSLLAEKKLAVTRCGDAGLGVVLVPMVVPGVNDQELGAILDFGVNASPTVRGIHIQPVSYFGRRPALPQNQDRITLPEILAALESQSRGRVRTRDFRPPGCENALCSFNGRFFITESGGLKPLATLPAALPAARLRLRMSAPVALLPQLPGNGEHARDWGAGTGCFGPRLAGGKGISCCSSRNDIPGLTYPVPWTWTVFWKLPATGLSPFRPWRFRMHGISTWNGSGTAVFTL